MLSKISTAALVGAMAAGFAGTASADDESRIAQLEAQVAQLQAQTQGDWLTEARADEVRGLVQDVLADSATRATLLQEGMAAGIDDNGHVFMQSANGQFSMNIAGQIQFRYYFNFQDDRGGTSDEARSTFNVRRAKVKFSGSVAEDWDYTIVLATDRGDGNVFAEDVIISHDLGEGWKMQAGIFKLPFARQELISSTRQVAVDRGLATEFFTLNRAEQVQFNYSDDQWKFAVALSDGANSGYTDLPGGASNDFAITARADVRLDGEWGDAKHEFGSDSDALFVGGAVHYQKADGSATIDDQFVWTVDALWKTGGFGISAAVFGNHVFGAPGVADVDQFGAYGQISYILDEKWNVFGRLEYIDDDTAADELLALTVGLNYHFNDNVKFTTDIIYTISGDDPSSGGAINGGESSSGLGMQSGFTDDDEQLAWRAQLQLLF
ncbi:MAG: porin [Phycisphaerales bacterium JB063]